MKAKYPICSFELETIIASNVDGSFIVFCLFFVFNFHRKEGERVGRYFCRFLRGKECFLSLYVFACLLKLYSFVL